MATACLVLGGETKVEDNSPVAVAISSTLIGSVIFVMGLYYLTNFPDEDIRKNTYKVICETIAIFCAVLLFVSIHDVIHDVMKMILPSVFDTPEEHVTTPKLVIDFCVFLFWYAVLQISLAFLSGAVGKFTNTEGFDNFPLATKYEFLEKIENNMKCIAVLLAHIAGFASINVWGNMQQLPSLKQSSLYTFLTVPCALVAQFTLQQVTNCIRYRITFADSVETIFEREWDTQTAEAEDDIMSLTLSFMLTQTFRFAISGHLPDPEGMDREEWLGKEGPNAVWLLIVAIVFLVISYVCSLTMAEVPVEDDSMNTVPTESDGEAPSYCAEIKVRAIENLLLSTGMVFAWSSFFGIRWYISSLSFVKGKNEGPDMELVGIMTALLVSLASLVALFVLDWFNDHKAGANNKVAILRTITSIGLLVGFAWEQCFHESVKSIADAAKPTLNPQVLRLVMAFLSVLLVAPAWKFYLLPMSQHDGWRFGFVPKKNKLEMANLFLDDKKSDHKKFTLPKKRQHSTEDLRVTHGVVPSGEALLEMKNENERLKKELKTKNEAFSKLDDFCREHMETMSSTMLRMMGPLKKVEEGVTSATQGLKDGR